MDLAVTGKVRIDGLGGDFLDRVTGGEVLLQHKLAEVVGEVQHAARRQARHGQVDQLHLVTLYVENPFHALGVGEGRRIDEDQVELVTAGIQPDHHVTLLQAVLVGETVQRQVATRPVEVGFRQVDAGSGAGAALGRVNTGGRGVAIQIEEALAGRLFLDTHAHWTVVEEQPGVEVVGEVHQQLDAAFVDLDELALCRLAFVLFGAALTLAALDHHAALDVQGLRNRCQGIEHPGRGFFRVDGFRRGVLLDVDPILIQVDGHRVFRHVGVIHAIAVDAFTLDPLAHGLEVLLQAVGKHLPAFAQARLLDHHRSRFDRVAVLVVLLVLARRHVVVCNFDFSLFAFYLTLFRSATFASDELIRRDLDQQQLARQRAVPERILFVAADAHALAQVGRAGEYRRFPVQAGLTQTLAQVLVEVKQACLVTQALAVRRVADDQAFLVLVRTWLEGANFALVDLDPLAQACTFNVVAARLNQAWVSFVTANPQRWLGQAGSATLGGFFVEFFPQRRNVTEPGRKAPLLATQVRRHIGGDHGGFYQERADTAHWVSQRAAFGCNAWPAGTDQDRGREVFLQRCRALLQAITTLVQAVAGQVEGKDRFATVQAQVNAQVRVDLVDGRTFAGRGAQLVDDSVLDLQGAEVGVVDARAVTAELNGQRAVVEHMVLPLDVEHAVVQVFGVLHRETLEHQQHPVRQTRPQAQAISGFHGGHAAHGRGVFTRFFKAKPDGFLDEQAFKAFGASEEDFELIGHWSFKAFG